MKKFDEEQFKKDTGTEPDPEVVEVVRYFEKHYDNPLEVMRNMIDYIERGRTN